MQLFVKTHLPVSVTIEVEPTDTIASIKAIIEDKLQVPSASQRLIYLGKVLEDGRSIQDYHIESETTLRLALHVGDAGAAQEDMDS